MKKLSIIFGIIFFITNSFSSEDLLSQIDMTKVSKISDGPHIPYKSNPNLETLKYYLYLYNSALPTKGSSYIVKPSAEPYKFKSKLSEFKFLDKEMKKKGIVSYLFFDKDHIVVDKISPKERLGNFLDNETFLRSNSVGKTMVSYVLGHAICEGYIDGVDAKINDWHIVKDTLYENHKLIDLLNMTSGDQKYIYDSNLLKDGKPTRDEGYNVDNWTLDFYTDFFKDKKSAKKKYNYNVINTNLIFNYVKFKSKNDFQKILDLTFQKKSKIKKEVFFPIKSNADHGIVAISNEENKNFLKADPMFYATRYDYLRIAKAILDDYQNNTGVGKYLREIYKRKIPKNINHDGLKSEPRFNRTLSYGGQFHLDYPGLKNKTVFGMGGFAGQAILIDMENSRIVVVNSIHYNNDNYKYNHKKLLIDPIKYGKKAFDK